MNITTSPNPNWVKSYNSKEFYYFWLDGFRVFNNVYMEFAFAYIYMIAHFKYHFGQYTIPANLCAARPPPPPTAWPPAHSRAGHSPTADNYIIPREGARWQLFLFFFLFFIIMQLHIHKDPVFFQLQRVMRWGTFKNNNCEFDERYNIVA